MDSTAWDERYAASDLVWSAGPNVWVEEVASELPAGTALDLAAGEGRNALWLVEQGWRATAVDFSGVALERAGRIAAERLGDTAGRLRTVTADVTRYADEDVYDLVLVVYLQLPADARRDALRAAAQRVAPGGRLLVVAHHSDNPAEGVGGPPHPAVLYTEQDVVADVEGLGLTVERAERALRDVAGARRQAVDTLVVLSRTA
jgi:SAM-dependent methyltransferase